MYRNWTEIKKLDNWYLRLALTTVEYGSEEQELLARVFPQCFSDKRNLGPIPWSVLEEKHRALEAVEQTGCFFVAADAFDLPTIVIVSDKYPPEGTEGKIVISDNDKAWKTQQKETVIIHGKSFVVIEAVWPGSEGYNDRSLTVIPPELIDVES